MEEMEQSTKCKLISLKNQIESKCIDYDDVISTIEAAFVEYDARRVILPDKISLIFDEGSQERINCMPSALLDKGICGVKWVSVFPNNPQRFGISNVNALIVLSDTEKGRPIAVMDGTMITALRTAAMGAIAAKHLARKNASKYGTIGTGEQAKMHFRIIKHVIPGINTCFVSSRKSESEKSFIEELSKEYPQVNFVACSSDYRKASRDADILVTAVSCQEPLLKADSIKEGAFYCHVGGWEDEYEVPLKADKIICDDWEAIKHRGSPTIARLYSKGMLCDEGIYCNLADLITGKKPGRENEREFIYFNSVGLSFVDVSVAYRFYCKAVEKKQFQEWEI